MTKILKGDTSPSVQLVLAEGFDYTGATVEVRYQGAVRTYTGRHAGETIAFSFSADETAPMVLGAFPVTVRIATANGGFFTVDNGGVKIAVTDDPAEVWVDGVIAVDAHGMLYGITDLPAHYTDKDVVAKIREIMRRGGAMLCAALLCGFAFGASVQTAQKQDIWNDGNVVTYVDFTGLATEDYVRDAVQDAGGMTEQGVREIVTELGEQFGKVKSVNGHDGEVNLSAADIGAVPTTVTNDVKVQLSEKLDILPNGSTNGIRLAVSGSGLKVDADANVSIRVSGSRSMSDYGITNRFVSSVNGNPVGADGNVNVPTVPDDYDEVKAMAEAAQTADDVQSAIANAGHVTADELEPIEENVNNALLYSQAIYRYMVGNGSAWFESTNYNVNAEQAAEKVRYQPEPWEDVRYTPPSLQLFEIRGGVTNRVFDSRDWTVYYWNFKSAQLSNALARATFDLGENVRTNYMRRGWSKYTAVNGLDNPATDTTWIDTPKVSLFAGHQWEKLVEVGGAGYYTITGNGIELAAQDAESTFLTIKDFEGNACLTFRKTSSYLVYCECGTDIVSTYRDSQNRVVFHLTTDVQPTAEFSTILDTDSFIEQGEDGCPANYEWTGSANNWDCHFLLKPGISSDACFARFKVMREGENVVEHTVPIKLNGGIVFEQNGQALKCKPVAQGTSVGSAVNWVIAQ